MEEDEQKSALGRILGIAVGVGLISGLLWLLMTADGCAPDQLQGSEDDGKKKAPSSVLLPGEEEMDEAAGVKETPAEALETLGIGLALENPAELIAQIGEKLAAGEISEASQLIGRGGLSSEQWEQLRALSQSTHLHLRESQPVNEIGELEINRRARWALNLKEEGRRIYFDLLRGKDGKWRVEKVTFPTEPKEGETPVARAVMVDALGIADAFLQASLRQDFEVAKSFVDQKEVSDAKLAGLCIVFEEGEYRLRSQKPLRGLFHREETAAFLVNVEDGEGVSVAQFGVSLQREGVNHPWRVTEINLDQLLADYAQRVAGGDIYYSPLVKNPNGGDTIVLYFDFDEDAIEPRSERQLEIVTLLLQTDAKKKIHISGHTDAFGSKEYNQKLSRERAEAVKAFLIDSGVAAEQIVTKALGQTQPRRPNTTESGEDDPSGRRANRRTEIYLDF